MPKVRTLGVVGLGLIGGSMAKVSAILGSSGIKYGVGSAVSVFVLSLITLVHSVVKFILSKQIEKQAE